MKKIKLFLFSLVAALLLNGLLVNTAVAATCTWTGAINTNWDNAGNWDCMSVPGSDDDVVLDNSVVSGNYSITLPGGATTTTIRRLTITPNSGNSITLILPTTNTNNPGLLVGDSTASTDDIILNDGAVLVNSSQASSGSGIAFQTAANGTFRINNGGRYIHNTGRDNAAVATLLSTAAGTEKGIFEFDVQGIIPYSISASGRNYGDLVLTRTLAPATYTASGTDPLTIRGDFTINSGTHFNNSMTGDNNIAGNWVNNGFFTPNATTVVFNGTVIQAIGGSRPTAFNNLVVNSGASVTIPTNTTAASLVNNGRIQQTQTVAGAGAFNFLALGGYGGLTIENSGIDDLGVTTVIIQGNQACTTTDSVVRRCFDITPTPMGPDTEATLTFYYAEHERNDLNCLNMHAWHWDSGWELAGEGGSAYQCGSEPYSVVVEGVTEFSPFVLFDDPVTAPTAVTLQSITAATAVTTPLILLLLLVAGLSAMAVILRHQTRA